MQHVVAKLILQNVLCRSEPKISPGPLRGRRLRPSAATSVLPTHGMTQPGSITYACYKMMAREIPTVWQVQSHKSDKLRITAGIRTIGVTPYLKPKAHSCKQTSQLLSSDSCKQNGSVLLLPSKGQGLRFEYAAFLLDDGLRAKIDR